MVCKDDILLWFKESASYKRIDVICNILNMCIPFELRFVGTFLETIGKHSYQELRGAELKANNPVEIGAEAAATVAGLSDGIFRRKITLYLSLLHSYNHTCAKTIFDILTRIDLGEILAKSKSNTEGNVLEEMLLLYTMAINHPAFSFEQYACLGKILMQLLEEEKLNQPYTQNLIQRIPKPCNYYNTREEIPPTIPGPPPGIPLAPTVREPFVTPKWTPPPPNPPSPHLAHTQESPINSRTGSPVSIQPIHPANRPQNVKSSWRQPPFQNRQEITTRKMVNCVDDKESDISAWRNSGVRTQNGMRPGTRNDLANCTQQQTYCASQLDGLILDPEAQHHYSSSSESGRSSVSQSPPGTPHTPGRRKSDTSRPRMNGRLSDISSSSQPHQPLMQPPHTLPPQQPSQQPPPPHIAPPIPPSGFTQTSVPYTAAFMSTGAPFNRNSMYTTYTPQNYRPQFSYQPPNGEILVQYASPYLPFMFPSQILEPKSCFNCGTSEHKGPDCPEPTMEEITRSGNYQMDYSTPTATPPDCPGDK